MKIKVSELRTISKHLFEYLIKSGRNEIEIEEDYYWYIKEADVYNSDEDPTDFEMGQLTDDMDELRKIKTGESPPLGYALFWLSSILRIVGEKTVD